MVTVGYRYPNGTWCVRIISNKNNFNKMEKQNIRKITKNGQGTYYISILKDLMKELKFKERQKVVVKKHGKGILITDWKKV